MLLLWEVLLVQLTSYGPLEIHKSGESIMLQLVVTSTLHFYTMTHLSFHHWTLVILEAYINVKYCSIRCYLLQLKKIIFFPFQVATYVYIYKDLHIHMCNTQIHILYIICNFQIIIALYMCTLVIFLLFIVIVYS